MMEHAYPLSPLSSFSSRILTTSAYFLSGVLWSSLIRSAVGLEYGLELVVDDDDARRRCQLYDRCDLMGVAWCYADKALRRRPLASSRRRGLLVSRARSSRLFSPSCGISEVRHLCQPAVDALCGITRIALVFSVYLLPLFCQKSSRLTSRFRANLGQYNILTASPWQRYMYVAYFRFSLKCLSPRSIYSTNCARSHHLSFPPHEHCLCP